MICILCGCTDDYACPGGCWWVAPNLCSRCGEWNRTRRRYRPVKAPPRLQQLRHACFDVDVDGVAVEVIGDSDMSAETRAALTEVVRAIRGQFGGSGH